MYAAQYRALTLAMFTRDEDGNATAPTTAPAVSVIDSTGTAIATGTATSGTGGVGSYTYTLPSAATNALGDYIVRFTYAISGSTYRREYPVTVYGAHLFEIDDLRSFDVSIADSSRYSAAAIRAARDEATSWLEQAAGVSFSPRAAVEYLNGDGTRSLLLANAPIVEISAVAIDGDWLDTADLEDVLIYEDSGILHRDLGWDIGNQNVTVEYVHGMATVDPKVKRAAMMLAVEAIVTSGVPSRAMTQSSDLGEFRISLANVDAGRPTGIPEVDAVIALYGRRAIRIR